MLNIGVKDGTDLGQYAIVAGDPGRIPQIAEHFDDAKKLAQCREFTLYGGTLEGQKACICSHGVGGPSAAIVVEELAQCGVKTIIRVGTCAAMNPIINNGDVVIASSCVRQEGTTLQYMPVEFPATADFTVAKALQHAAEEMGQPLHVGIVQSKDSYYGQQNPDRMPLRRELREKWEAWKQAGVLASEMEGATIFVVSSLLGVRAGMVLLSVWNHERPQERADKSVIDNSASIKTGVQALRLLIREGDG